MSQMKKNIYIVKKFIRKEKKYINIVRNEKIYRYCQNICQKRKKNKNNISILLIRNLDK